ncbi:MAG TPA: hypothetical protein ENN29_10915 [Candidatus Hydrogenedentes bacterium]|nr:hypothetical protein [Candidatus Hydrogenedentota bacterium]
MYTWISRCVFLSFMLVAVSLFTGCNADPRLNGVWEGKMWEFGQRDETHTLIVTAQDGKASITFVRISYSGGSRSAEAEGTYTTNLLAFPHRILLKFDDEDTAVRCSYRFAFPLFSNTFYLSINEEEGGGYPERYMLDPKEGPVYVMKRQDR